MFIVTRLLCRISLHCWCPNWKQRQAPPYTHYFTSQFLSSEQQLASSSVFPLSHTKHTEESVVPLPNATNVSKTHTRVVRKVRPFWISREPVAWPWCNLAASQRKPYCAPMNSHSPVGLVSQQWDTTDWVVNCDHCIHKCPPFQWIF